MFVIRSLRMYVFRGIIGGYEAEIERYKASSESLGIWDKVIANADELEKA